METNKDSRLKICWMRIVGFQQFQDVFLDFTHPETGEPLDKICFIGANGTGKTVLLERLVDVVNRIGNTTGLPSDPASHLIFAKIILDDKVILHWISNRETGSLIWDSDDLADLEKPEIPFLISNWPKFEYFQKISGVIGLGQLDQSLLVYAPAESAVNSYLDIHDVPETTLSSAVLLKENFPFAHLVASSGVNQFWRVLLYQCHVRREAQEAFELMEENLDRTKRDLVADFDSRNPKILEELGKKWDRILEKTGLEFDATNAIIPFQPLENLKAYIVSRSSKGQIPYNKLSTGIRNYIFRLGHIFSLYFRRDIQRGILIVDEPENGLFPDFLYDLISVYKDVVGENDTKTEESHTQMFFATHEPIIAAQFEPYERIILEWNDDGTVRSRRGTSPIGDDPNDVLKQDFGVQSLMGAPGKVAFARYRKLKSLLKTESDPSAKEAITTEYLELGRLYNFPA